MYIITNFQLNLKQTKCIRYFTMPKTMCRICLRSDFERTGDIDDRLAEFHDELCGYDVLPNERLKFCSICEYLLRKFFIFRKKCRRAHKILKTSKQKKNGIENLQDIMPPSSIGFSITHQQVYSHIPSKNTDLQPCLTFKNITHHNMVDGTTADEDYVVCKLEEDIDKIDPILATPEIKQEYVPIPCIQENILPESCKQSNELTARIQENVEESLKNEDLISFEEENDCREAEYLFGDNKTQISDGCDKKQITDGDDKKQISEGDDKQISHDDDYKNEIPKLNKEKNTRTKRVPKVLKDELVETDLTSVDDLESLNISAIAKNKNVLQAHRKKLKYKERACSLLEQGKLDLGDNVTMTKEDFSKMFDKCADTQLKQHGVFKKGPLESVRLKKFLLYLMKRHSPEYESVFVVQQLNTRARKLAEFAARQLGADYALAPHKCRICYKGFQLPTLLDYHNKWHDASRPHACDICSMRFPRLKNLQSHGKSHEAVYRCKLCNVVIYQYDAMINHYQAHKGKQYTCDVCLGEYRSNSSLNSHRLTHATHACAVCARRFVSDNGLRNHVKMKHPEAAATKSLPTVSCDKCGATFESRDTLQIHARQRHYDGKCVIYQCRYMDCVKTFDSPESLRSHTLNEGHARRDPARPEQSGPWSRGRREVNVTQKEDIATQQGVTDVRKKACGPCKVTGVDKPYRTCPICEQQVANTAPTSLYLHHVASHPELPYTTVAEHSFLCDQCGKSFRVRSVYVDHLNTHSGVKPHMCSKCEARFHTKHSLYLHSLRHRPPKYKCEDCGKVFLTAPNLYVHKRSHIGDRRFKCGICHKGFLHQGSVKEHINGVHNQIRRIKKPTKTTRKRAEDLKPAR